MRAVTLYFNVSFISWTLIVAQDFAMCEMSTSNGMAKVRINSEKLTPFGGFFRAWSLYTFFWLLLWGVSYILCVIEPSSVCIDLDFCRH